MKDPGSDLIRLLTRRIVLPMPFRPLHEPFHKFMHMRCSEWNNHDRTFCWYMDKDSWRPSIRCMIGIHDYVDKGYYYECTRCKWRILKPKDDEIFGLDKIFSKFGV